MTNVKSISRTVLVDAALLTVACLIPSLSHLLAFPLYKLNPMLLVMMGGMLLVDSRWNAYLMALLVPWVTCLAVGMPSVSGALCMTLEFAMVVTVVTLLAPHVGRRFWGLLALALGAILAGKVVYYTAKWLLINPDQLVTTSPAVQAVSVLAIAVLFALVAARKRLSD